MTEESKEKVKNVFKKMSKIIERDYMVISKRDFEEIYKLIDNMNFNEERIIDILEYIHYILDGLYHNIKYYENSSTSSRTQIYFLICANADFSRRDTCAWDIPISSATSI